MPRRIAIIAIIIVILLIGSLIGIFFFMSSRDAGGTVSALRDFLPFGNSPDRDVTTPPPPNRSEDALGTSVGGDDSAPLPALRQLHDRASAGAFVFGEGSSTTIRFIERETGHVFEITRDARLATRITNTTIPRAQNTLWVNENTLLIRYFADDNETLQTFVARIESEDQNTPGMLVGTFLPQNIRTLATEAAGLIFYTSDGEQAGFVTTAENDTPIRVLAETPFTEWLATWVGANTISLATKPSAAALGSLYFLNINTDRLTRVVGDRFGLTALVHPDRSQILLGEARGRAFLTSVFDVTSAETSAVPLTTLPEKCVWSRLQSALMYCGVPDVIPANAYPDSWYQGLVSFTDSIWMLNIVDGTTELLVKPEDLARRTIDVTEPQLSPDERTLLFMNKKDNTIWSLTLPERATPDAGASTSNPF